MITHTPILFIFLLFLSFYTLTCNSFAGELVPENLFNIGDSIGEAEAAQNVIGRHHHDKVWSTGFDESDEVFSFNERFSDLCPKRFQKNDAAMDNYFNQAISGSVMSDFAKQASNIVNLAMQTTTGTASMITIYLGNNDVCSDSLESMISPAAFESYYRAGLDVLADSDETNSAIIHISSIPAIYWLWVAMRNNDWCLAAWQLVPCKNMLGNPINDCGTGESYLEPDTTQVDDGPNCRRRKTIHTLIRDTYNPILKNVLAEYVLDGRLANAYYNDIFGIRFKAEHINTGDCFHPSVRGQAFLAQKQWEKSPWFFPEPVCSEQTQQPVSPWLHLLLSY